MRLFADQLLEVLKALGTTPANAKRSEKRSFFRVGARYQVQLKTDLSPTGLNAWVRDISSAGVGLLCPMALPLGSTLSLELPRRLAEQVSVPCVIRNCNRVALDAFQIGTTFVNDFRELRLLLSQSPLAKSA